MTDWPLILAEHGVTVWRTVYRLLDHHADALDCYQETFLAAWRFAEREPVANWRSFLVSLAMRRAMDRLRQRYRDRARVIAQPRAEHHVDGVTGWHDLQPVSVGTGAVNERRWLLPQLVPCGQSRPPK